MSNNNTSCKIEGQSDLLVGPLFIRPVRIGKGETTGNHFHSFDHVSLVLKGSVHVRTFCPCRPDEIKEQIFEAPSFFLVRADTRHAITGIDDQNLVWCTYTLRDPDGGVSQSWDGWGTPRELSPGSDPTFQ